MSQLATSPTRSDVPLKAGRHARFIYIYLPDLATAQIARRAKLDQDSPLALYQAVKGADRLCYTNAAARAFGLHPDMVLSDARALSPLCRFFVADHEADQAWLHLLASWCWRYSPVVGVDPDRLGVWIDATGASHLWGGEAAMLADIQSHFAAHQLTAHIVMASYYGAAIGVALTQLPQTPQIIAADPKAHEDAMTGLPLAALRLSPAEVTQLTQLGLQTIGDIHQMKRGLLAMRFHESVLRRKDQILGHASERPIPLPHLQPVLIQQHYVEPVAGLEPLNEMVAGLLKALCDLLAQMGLGCREVEIGWQTTDRKTGYIRHHLSRPSRTIALFMRLFAEAGAQIEAGFGIEYGWAKAGGVSPQSATALIFDDTGQISEDEADKISQLVDHLAARLGAHKVQTLVSHDVWQPEEAQALVPAQRHIMARDKRGTLDIRPPIPAPSLAPRPLRLLSVPDPIQVIALLPDHPPSQIRWRHQNWRIRRATGPERIGPRWWQATPSSDYRSRDYYRLETEDGQRLWVYRQGLRERGDKIDWFLHGFFA